MFIFQNWIQTQENLNLKGIKKDKMKIKAKEKEKTTTPKSLELS